MNTKIRYISQYVLIIFALFSVQNIFLSYEQKNTETTLDEIIITIKTLNDAIILINRITTDYQQCHPKCSHLNEEIDQAKFAVQKLIRLYGKEGSPLSIKGKSSYHIIEANLNAYENQKKMATNTINDEITVLVDDYKTLVNIAGKTRKDAKINQYISLIASQLILFLLITTIIYKIAGKYLAIKTASRDIANSVRNISTSIADWDITNINDQLNKDTINELERRAYSKAINIQEKLEETYDQMDVYQSLYTMIGYEIRSISSSIKGGLKILVKDAEESTFFLSQDIYKATTTLENLAENFNLFLSRGRVNDGDFVSVNEISTNISSAITSKVKSNQSTIECFIDPRIPPTLHGNYVSLYWVLILNYSNKLQKCVKDHYLFSTTYESNKDIDKVTIHFDLISYEDGQATLDDIINADWKKTDDASITKSISGNIIKGINKPNIDEYAAQGNQKLRISVAFVPHRFDNDTNILSNTKLLVCGRNGIQVDIIVKILEFYGAEVIAAETPNQVFKSIGASKGLSGVMITDSMSGVEFESFCKTLKSRLSKSHEHARLFVSIGRTETYSSIHQIVDHIFYRPIGNDNFVSKISQALASSTMEKSQIDESVLVVDDDEIQQIFLTHILSDMGIQSEVCSSGEEALDYYKEHQPSVIFMDCIMPGIGGFEATRLIREEEVRNQSNRAIIIAATALTSAKEKKQCIDHGMDYVVEKPFKDDEIQKIIKNYMAIRKIN